MRRPPDHPMRPNGPIVECPHCGKNYPAEDGPVCVRCGGRLSKYNTNARSVNRNIIEPMGIWAWVKETQRTKDMDWPDKEVITFE